MSREDISDNNEENKRRLPFHELTLNKCFKTDSIKVVASTGICEFDITNVIYMLKLNICFWNLIFRTSTSSYMTV